MGEQKGGREQRKCAGEGQGRLAKGRLPEEQSQDHNNARETAEAQRRTLDGGSGAYACQLFIAESLRTTVLQDTSH